MLFEILIRRRGKAGIAGKVRKASVTITILVMCRGLVYDNIILYYHISV